ncbi:MAG TPA: hypothetical protein VK530_13640 [Candidatus Acidoferrum sp.]|nr:hypothetical protein [Candidatus Acidoferrum sp.]
MPVEFINDHVLFPERPNWAFDPEWSRAWQTQVSTGLEGPESRAGMRAIARVTLKWTPSIRNLQERSQLDDRVRAALLSGKACCAYWGRGSKLSLDCSADAVTLQATPWTFAEGDWIFFLDQATREYNVRQITDVTGLVLTLDDAVDRTFLAHTMVWPLLFGRLAEDAMDAETNHHGNFTIAITETNPAGAGTPIGDYTPPDPEDLVAIPDMEIGDSFVVR